ncbi:hypothetical protein EYF80_038096 [Liparis tanakae]|uniref:Uncharacterized protein n=1 Tax=Liparis tanakae TaxID=230148 RepID=A0A4Z2GG20_9TELE|nr:hypothetical protein EYF80_038096 [Liparis tanakae]
MEDDFVEQPSTGCLSQQVEGELENRRRSPQTGVYMRASPSGSTMLGHVLLQRAVILLLLLQAAHTRASFKDSKRVKNLH